MSIYISPATYYSGNVVTADTFVDLDGRAERAIRTDVTLDNRVVVTDSGFSWGRTTQRIVIRHNQESYNSLLMWLQGWPEVVVCRPDGVWLCVLKDVSLSTTSLKPEINITLLVIERISE